MSYLWGKETLSFLKRGFKKWISLSLQNCNSLCTGVCLSLRNRDLQSLGWLVLLTEKAGGFHVPTWLQRAAMVPLHCTGALWVALVCVSSVQPAACSLPCTVLDTVGHLYWPGTGTTDFHDDGCSHWWDSENRKEWGTTVEESANDAKIIMNLGCAG